MRRFLLDTGPLAAYLLNRDAPIEQIRPWIRDREAATSILVYGEIIEYLQGRSDYRRRAEQLRTLLQEIPPFLPSYRVLEQYATLRRRLRPPHGPGLIGDIDTLIAAAALEYDLTVVTTDTDFQRVPGIKVMILPARP